MVHSVLTLLVYMQLFTQIWNRLNGGNEFYIQLLFTVYTVDKTQISVQLQQNTKAIYSTSINEQFETNLS